MNFLSQKGWRIFVVFILLYYWKSWADHRHIHLNKNWIQQVLSLTFYIYSILNKWHHLYKHKRKFSRISKSAKKEPKKKISNENMITLIYAYILFSVLYFERMSYFYDCYPRVQVQNDVKNNASRRNKCRVYK